MEDFGENYRQGKETKLCPLCNSHKDNEEESFYCKEVNEKVKVEGSFLDIFEEEINQSVVETLKEIMGTRAKVKDHPDDTK